MNRTFTDLHDQALTLGDHIEQMREAYEALERERDALAAKLDRLQAASEIGAVYSKNAPSGMMVITEEAAEKLAAAYMETPIQSLNHVKAQIAERQCSELAAQVEEETKGIIQKAIVTDRVLDLECKARVFDMIKTSPNKYAKQAGSTVEEEG